MYHPARLLYEKHIKGQAEPAWRAKYLKWSLDHDPLADVFLVTFGSYPQKDQTGQDYEDLFQHVLCAEEIEISASPMPPDAYAGLTPSALSTCDLSPANLPVRDGRPGIYPGS